MTHYKAFDDDMKCRGFQFEIGRSYIHEEPIAMCHSGFHCCENILNCLEYYPEKSRYCTVDIGGENITSNFKTVTNKITVVKELSKDELEDLLTGSVMRSDKAMAWYKSGKLYRDGGLPAVECPDGSKEWYQNGILHRDGGLPAVEHSSGSKVWYQNGILHRDGGLHAVEHSSGSKVWYQNGKLHRDGGLPAIECADGSKEWYQNGKLHRDGGLPAIEHFDGRKEWYQKCETS